MGGDIEIPTLTKKILLTIPPETQTGKVFKVKDKGAGSLHGRTRGDLFVRVVVETPTNLSSKDMKEMRNLFLNIQENYPEHKTYMDQLNKKFDD
jgi:molecular chaperone DnaJ